MSVNSSSSSNDSLLHPVFNFSMPFNLTCLITTPGSINFITFNITLILLLLPLCILVLHHGLHQWRQKRSTSSAVTVSHSDSFTYHLVTMELLRVFACSLSCGVYMKNLVLLTIEIYVFSFTWFGETFFHLLTCVERYLAVIHPIIYLSLKTERGIGIRNIISGCVWVLSFAGMCVDMFVPYGIVMNFFILVLSLIIVSFCSLSVLCVLIRPGPGERGGDRERVDQSKLRAFYTITAILGMLVFRFACGLIWVLLYVSNAGDTCVLMTFEFWVYLPSSLVLPLLFLQRVGKLECCKKNIQRG